MILSYGKLLGQVFTIFSSRQCCLATMPSGENLRRSSPRITDIWWRSSSRMIMRYCSTFNSKFQHVQFDDVLTENSNLINLTTFSLNLITLFYGFFFIWRFLIAASILRDVNLGAIVHGANIGTLLDCVSWRLGLSFPDFHVGVWTQTKWPRKAGIPTEYER